MSYSFIHSSNSPIKPALSLTVLCFGLLFATGCNFDQLNVTSKAGAAIKLGDSSTIVTETDPQYLQDEVADMNPAQIGNQPSTSATVNSATDNEPAESKTDEIVAESSTTRNTGFKIDFGSGVVVFVNGLDLKELSPQNPSKSSGVSYKTVTGLLNQGTITITGLKDVKIKLRYQSFLNLVNGKERLALTSLGGYLSPWSESVLKAGQNDFALNGLSNIEFNKNVTAAILRNAIQRSRISAANKRTWSGRVAKVRSVKDAPCQVVLDNAQFQISGKTADGVNFFKTIRLDQ